MSRRWSARNLPLSRWTRPPKCVVLNSDLVKNTSLHYIFNKLRSIYQLVMFFFCARRRSFKVPSDEPSLPKNMLIMFEPVVLDRTIIFYPTVFNAMTLQPSLSGDSSDFKLGSANNTRPFSARFWTRDTHVGRRQSGSHCECSRHDWPVVKISTRGSCDPGTAGFACFDRPGRFVGRIIYIRSG